jgi:hypothetical protein
LNTEELKSSAHRALDAIENGWPVTMLEELITMIGDTLRETLSKVDREDITSVVEMHNDDIKVDSDRDYMLDVRESLLKLEAACDEAVGLDEVMVHWILDDIMADVRRNMLALAKTNPRIRNLSLMIAKRDMLDRLLDMADDNGM